MNSTRCGLLLAAGLAGILTIAACKGTGQFTADGTYRDHRVGVGVSWSNQRFKVDETPVRLDVRFLDAAGNQVGTQTTGATDGSVIPIPAGATHVQVRGPSSHGHCTGCSNGPSPAGGGMPSVEPFTTDVEFLVVQTLDADLAGTSVFGNLHAVFTFPGAGDDPFDALHALVVPILIEGPGAPVNPDVRVESLVRMLARPSGGLFQVAERGAPFASFEMVWNDRPHYASLAHNSTLRALPNQWAVVEVFVPAADFQFQLPGAENGIRATWRALGEPVDTVLAAGHVTG